MKTLHLKMNTVLGSQGISIIPSMICMLFFVFSAAQLKAQGSLMIIPKRVLFDGNKKMQEVNLANIGFDTSIYDISVVNMSVTDSGKQDFIRNANDETDTTQNFADKFLRVYPRQVSLWANKTQTVKVQLVHTGLLKPGEYRSHLYFRAVQKELPLGEKEKNKPDSAAGITIAPLRPIFGLTIPVIVRVGGVSDLTIDMADMHVKNDEDGRKLCLTFSREGNISAYGALTVTYVPKQGAETQVGYARGISVYTTNHKRYFELPLEKKEGVDYNEGKLHVVFKNLDKGKANILAEAELPLNATNKKQMK